MTRSIATSARSRAPTTTALAVFATIVALATGCGTLPIAAPAAATPTSAIARTQAKVVSVVDGDTIRVSINGQVYPLRYIGMNAAEWGRPYYEEATAQNQRLVGGKTVWLEKDVSETDRYGRLLRYVYVDGTMVNAELVRQGYAEAGTYPPDVKYNDWFLQLEREARRANRGLWGLPPTSTPTRRP